MKTLVAYSSVYGSTEQYAKLLADKLNADLLNVRKNKVGDFSEYDTIIFGGGLYAGKIRNIEWIVKNFKKINDKKIIVFSVGIADPSDEKIVENINNSLDKFLGEDIAKEVTLFNLRGAMDYESLKFLHKKMLGFVKKRIDKIPEDDRTPEDEAFLNNFNEKQDFVSEEAIKPIIECVK